MYRDNLASVEVVEEFELARPIAFVSEERTLLEDKITRETLLDYLVRVKTFSIAYITKE